MSGCSIHTSKGLKEWTIDPDSIQKMYPLLEKNYEVAGKYIIDEEAKKTRILTKFETQNGNSDSVQAPEGIVNFHTHPYSCYSGEETVWGWPSAEDVRETILFTLKGSVAHLVLAVEGVYTLQVNPCIIQTFIHMEDLVMGELGNIYINKKALKVFNKVVNEICCSRYNPQEKETFFNNRPCDFNILKYEFEQYLNTGNIGKCLLEFGCDIFRGMIVLCIEIYFRATHRFRLVDINTKNYMSPDDFIKFINSFKLVNIFSKGKEIRGCGKLTCGGVPVFENRQSTHKFKKYLIEYEKTTGFYLVNIHGDTLSLNISLYSISELFPYIKDLLIHSKPKCKNRYSSRNFNWSNNWFNLVLTPNLIKMGDKLIRYDSKKISGEQRYKFITSPEHYIQIDGTPKFFYFDLQGDCNYKNVSVEMKKKDENTKAVGFIIIGSMSCNWTKKLIKLLDQYNFPYNSKMYKSVKGAVNGANKFYITNIKNKSETLEYIPAVFIIDSYNNIHYIGGYNSAENLLNNMVR